MHKNLPEMFKASAEAYGNAAAFFSKNDKKEFEPFSFKELYDTGLALSEALIELGLQARDHVAVLADNRLEWIISDYGILCAGAANVPRGSDVTDSEIEYIVNHCGAKIVLLENDKLLERFNKIKGNIPAAEKIIVMDKASTASGNNVYKIWDLIARGKELRSSGKKEAESRIAQIKEDDLFTLIYTSGTTGMPKGVMLMHKNMMHQMADVVPMILTKAGVGDTMLSILPVWHIFERVVEYAAILRGMATYYTKVTELRNDFAKATPTFMASAPRVWESIYTGLFNRVNDPKQTPPVRRFLFNAAYFYSKHYHAALRFLRGIEVDYTGRSLWQSLKMLITAKFQLLFCGPFVLTLVAGAGGFIVGEYVDELSFLKIPLYVLAGLGLIFNAKTLDAVVLSKIRAATGGKLKASLSGGGALQRHVDAFFNDIGILVLEGYGMTETAPVITVREFKKPIIGSVGFLVPKSELQLRDDQGKVLTHINDKKEVIAGKIGQKGIVFLKGPQVMKGYYKNPEATSKAIVDGWMNTGDIGFINYKMALTLTGRAKDTIVLLGGENIEPVPLENKLDESPYIKQSMVFGQDAKSLGVIIVPEEEKLKEWCASSGVNFTNINDAIKESKVIDFYKKEVKEYVNTRTGFKSFELIQNVVLTAKVFEIGDELTNLLKMKRHVITEKYKEQIASVYK